MTLSWEQLLDEINQCFVKITRDKIFKKDTNDFIDHIQKCLKLNKKEDWNYILSAEDILEDSNAAIRNFLKFGLSGATKYNEIGEKYLRLYGLLNATYLQQQAIINLYRYFQCPDPQKIESEIELLEIRELRHKLGAHSADYKDRVTNDIYTFVPVRMMLEDFKCDYFNHITNGYHEVNLKLAVQSHLKLLCNIYYQILIKSVNTIYKNNTDKINSLYELAQPFKEMIDGAALMKNEHTGEFVVVKFVASSA